MPSKKVFTPESEDRKIESSLKRENIKFKDFDLFLKLFLNNNGSLNLSTEKDNLFMNQCLESRDFTNFFELRGVVHAGTYIASGTTQNFVSFYRVSAEEGCLRVYDNSILESQKEVLEKLDLEKKFGGTRLVKDKFEIPRIDNIEGRISPLYIIYNVSFFTYMIFMQINVVTSLRVLNILNKQNQKTKSDVFNEIANPAMKEYLEKFISRAIEGKAFSLLNSFLTTIPILAKDLKEEFHDTVGQAIKESIIHSTISKDFGLLFELLSLDIKKIEFDFYNFENPDGSKISMFEQVFYSGADIQTLMTIFQKTKSSLGEDILAKLYLIYQLMQVEQAEQAEEARKAQEVWLAELYQADEPWQAELAEQARKAQELYQAEQAEEAKKAEKTDPRQVFIEVIKGIVADNKKKKFTTNLSFFNFLLENNETKLALALIEKLSKEEINKPISIEGLGEVPSALLLNSILLNNQDVANALILRNCRLPVLNESGIWILPYRESEDQTLTALRCLENAIINAERVRTQETPKETPKENDDTLAFKVGAKALEKPDDHHLTPTGAASEALLTDADEHRNSTVTPQEDNQQKLLHAIVRRYNRLLERESSTTNTYLLTAFLEEVISAENHQNYFRENFAELLESRPDLGLEMLLMAISLGVDDLEDSINEITNDPRIIHKFHIRRGQVQQQDSISSGWLNGEINIKAEEACLITTGLSKAKLYYWIDEKILAKHPELKGIRELPFIKSSSQGENGIKNLGSIAELKLVKMGDERVVADRILRNPNGDLVLIFNQVCNHAGVARLAQAKGQLQITDTQFSAEGIFTARVTGERTGKALSKVI